MFCLYDYDINIVLFRIDISKEFKPLPSDSSINRILFSSTWQIDYGTIADWQEVVDYLHQVPQDVFAGQSVHVGTSGYDTSQSLLARVAVHGYYLPPR
jgi:hypothetical protein